MFFIEIPGTYNFSFSFSKKLFPEFTVGAFGFLVIGCAAFAGVFKFGLTYPSDLIVNTHGFLAMMAKTLGKLNFVRCNCIFTIA